MWALSGKRCGDGSEEKTSRARSEAATAFESTAVGWDMWDPVCGCNGLILKWNVQSVYRFRYRPVSPELSVLLTDPS